MAFCGAALTVQLSTSLDAVGLLNLCVSIAQLAAMIWFGRRPTPSSPNTQPRSHEPAHALAPTDEELIEQLEAARQQSLAHGARLGAAIDVLRADGPSAAQVRPHRKTRD